MRKAVGSPTWIAPEQVVGVRGDSAQRHLRHRRDAVRDGHGRAALRLANHRRRPAPAPVDDARPPRPALPDLPEWLQEVILRCLEPEAAQPHPLGRTPGLRPGGTRSRCHSPSAGGACAGLACRCISNAGSRPPACTTSPAPLPTRQIEVHPHGRRAARRRDRHLRCALAARGGGALAGHTPGRASARVSVISPSASSASDSERSETTLRRQHLARLKQWATGWICHAQRQLPCAGVRRRGPGPRYAEANRVSMMILGAATHGLQLQRFVATLPHARGATRPATVISSWSSSSCRSSSTCSRHQQPPSRGTPGHRPALHRATAGCALPRARAAAQRQV